MTKIQSKKKSPVKKAKKKVSLKKSPANKKAEKKKAPKKEKKKMGRPKKDIDKNAFESLCGLQCTRAEVCQFFGLTDKTLDKWCKETYSMTFSAIFKLKRGTGLISLRRTGFNLAKTNGSVFIFLAKNFLGMKDKPNEDTEDMEPVSRQVVIQAEDGRKIEIE